MAVNTYDLGDLVRCSGAFTNASDAAVDPDTVLFQFRTPSGDITTYTYGVDAELVRDSLGNYHVDVDANEVGEWWVRFYSTGSGQAADELSFEVSESRF
jgi:uncharacterized protein YfaS (alpha-2-macroglobulin family)